MTLSVVHPLIGSNPALGRLRVMVSKNIKSCQKLIPGGFLLISAQDSLS